MCALGGGLGLLFWLHKEPKLTTTTPPHHPLAPGREIRFTPCESMAVDKQRLTQQGIPFPAGRQCTRYCTLYVSGMAR
ncbi:hypothetical protein BX600DRAFT_462323 [Xylariales sp. PMI_506]|nr:hypothetical protein BX600DRAFT_462323 [Xylariales sp. PMI_506]